jgi:amidase
MLKFHEAPFRSIVFALFKNKNQIENISIFTNAAEVKIRINHSEVKMSLFSSPLIYLLVLSGFVNAIDSSQFTITEATIDDIQRAFTAKELTSRQLVDLYLGQIASLNPLLRSVLEVNPDARDQADQADREREEAAIQCPRSLGQLHGIPVLLKDSIATEDTLNTTCGSYALLGSKVPRDSGVVERLRRAGAVILGKASLTEWYGCRSTTIPDGWCARGGQGVVGIAFFFL